MRLTRRARLRAGCALGILGAVLLVGAPAANAAIITVNTFDDELNADGDCSLREAIQAANSDTAVDACTAGSGADNVRLGAGTYTLTIPGPEEDANATGDLDLTSNITLSGTGAATTTIDAAGLDRVLHVPEPAIAIEIIAMSLVGGAADGAGGILNNGTLTIANSAVSRNTSTGFGNPAGAIWNNGTATLADSVMMGNNSAGGFGGAVGNYGTLTLNRTTLLGNSANLSGGAITNYFGTGVLHVASSTFSGNNSGFGGGAGGGAIENYASATVTDTTFSRNSAGDGGGIRNYFGAATITNSTFDSNSAVDAGGGINTLGHFGLTLTNTTFAGNSAAAGGAINSPHAAGAVITSSTFSRNSATDGGAIWGHVHMTNSIVANSLSGGNCSATVIDFGGNLQHPGADCGATIPSADPLLDPAGLQNNGGPTQTIALRPGSPAIDAAAACPPPATDQRGVLRPQGAACDIGAFELETVVRIPQHFESYDLSQPERVTETGVTLIDQFGSRTVRIEEIEWLMNPVEKRRTGKDPVPIERADEHLTCYGLPVQPSLGLTVHVRNQFVGDSTLRIGRPLTLCTPAAKTLTGTPGSPPEDLDHFECYDVTSESPRFTSETLTLRDQFGTLTARIDRARELCNPVEKRRTGHPPEPIKRPEEHLVCYRIVSHTPAFSALTVFTNDQFGLDTLRVVSPRRLCVPSEKSDGPLSG